MTGGVLPLPKNMNHEGHEGHEEGTADLEVLARTVVDAGLMVHKTMGPGLLEPAYEQCLSHEFHMRGIHSRRQVALPIVHRGERLDAGYRLDILVDDRIIIEVKAADSLTGLHEAQLLTYLKLSGHRIGFLMNFNATLFKQGLRRLVL